LTGRPWSCAALYALVAALVVPRAAFLGEALFERDLHALWYPRAHSLARALGQLLPPLWDPAMGFGEPSLADPSVQLLYPTTWLLVALPPWTVYTLLVVLHLAFAAVGFNRLARASGLRPGAACFAGAAFMLAGPFVSLVNLWHHFAGAAWMPWVVLAVHRLVRRPRPAAAAWLGACLGMQVLAGSADMLLLTAALAAAWSVGVLGRASRRRPLGVALAGAGGVALALALSAGQWLPAVDAASRGLRRELPVELAERWAVPPAGLARMALPLDGSGRLRFAPAVQQALFDDPRREPFLASLYLGIVPLSLAGAAFAAGGRRRLLACLAVAGIVGTLAALGPHAVVADAVRALVPGASHLRYPSKAMVAPAFVCALLAAHGLAAVRRFGAARRLAGALALAGAAALGGAAALLGPLAPRLLSWGVLAEREGAVADALPGAARLAALALVALLAGAALLRAARPAGGGRLVGVLTLSAVAELWLAHHDLHPTAPPEALVAPPPVLSGLDVTGHRRVYVFDYALIEGAAALRLGRSEPYPVLQPPAGFDPRLVAALAQRIYPVPPVAATWGVEGSYDIDLTGLQPLSLWGLNLSLRHAEGTPAHARLLRLGAVSTVVALDRRGFEDLVPGPTYASLVPEPILTFAVPGALPRARIVGRARALDGRAALAALFEPAFDPSSEVVLSGPGARAAAAGLSSGAEGSPVRVVELRADRVRLELPGASAGIVVLADAWDPGWRAWVDGRPAPVLQANVAFRAVAVPAGARVVEMRYRPAPALAGLALTAASLVGLAGAAFLGRRGARRRPLRALG
jgi:hypothetical protein